jgi:hypothetical protein
MSGNHKSSDPNIVDEQDEDALRDALREFFLPIARQMTEEKVPIFLARVIEGELNAYSTNSPLVKLVKELYWKHLPELLRELAEKAERARASEMDDISNADPTKGVDD